MSARVLDGKREADKILADLKKQVAARRLPITLATIQVGRRPDSQLYLRLKTAAARRIGIRTVSYLLPAGASAARLQSLIRRLNRQSSVHGILLQLPLPKHLYADQAVALINPKKDVDGFLPDSPVLSPTVAAVMHLLKLAKPKKGAAAVVLGKESVFTAEVAAQLAKKGGKTEILPVKRIIPPATKRADIIVTVLGAGPMLKRKNIPSGAIVIDVGIRRRHGKTIGDVDPSIRTRAKAVSPVPGGVGPLTVAFVLQNTVVLASTKKKPSVT